MDSASIAPLAVSLGICLGPEIETLMLRRQSIAVCSKDGNRPPLAVPFLSGISCILLHEAPLLEAIKMSDDEEFEWIDIYITVVVSGPREKINELKTRYDAYYNQPFDGWEDSDEGFLIDTIYEVSLREDGKLEFEFSAAWELNSNEEVNEDFVKEATKDLLLYGIAYTSDQVTDLTRTLQFTEWDIHYEDNRSNRRNATKFYLTDAIPQETTNLQADDSNPTARPERVDLGRTFTLKQFQKLGPFYIPEKLIFDNLTQDDEVESGCLINYSENIEYPVLVTTKVGQQEFQRIYCAEEIAEWIGKYAKTKDPGRAPIVRIHIMTKQEVVAKEEALVEDKKKDLNETLAKLRVEKAPVGKIRALEYKISKFTYAELKSKREQDRREKERKATEEQLAKRRRLRVLNTLGALKF